jgi:hypothetical protein
MCYNNNSNPVRCVTNWHSHSIQGGGGHLSNRHGSTQPTYHETGGGYDVFYVGKGKTDRPLLILLYGRSLPQITVDISIRLAVFHIPLWFHTHSWQLVMGCVSFESEQIAASHAI